MIRDTINKMFNPAKKVMEEQENETIKKIMRWLIYDLPPIINSLVWFFGLIWIFQNLYLKFGFEKILISMLTIIIITLRGIRKNLAV